MPDSLAAIALGSNLPSASPSQPTGREQNLDTAIRHIGTLGRIPAVSTFHDTTPEDFIDQPRFLNAALLLETTLLPHDLLHALLEIERNLGRRRDGVPLKGPRLIDLDLLFYHDLVLSTPAASQAPALTLPHPSLHTRHFVLAPLAEIAPDWTHPILRKTVTEMLAGLPTLSPGDARAFVDLDHPGRCGRS